MSAPVRYHVDVKIPVLKAAAGKEPPMPAPGATSIADFQLHCDAIKRAREARKDLQEQYLRGAMELFASMLAHANLFTDQRGECAVRIHLEFCEADQPQRQADGHPAAA